MTPRTNDDEIIEAFGKYGEILSFRFKGKYCFVEYKDYRDAVKAVNGANRKNLFGYGAIVV